MEGLGFREVGGLTPTRGVPVSDETVRRWCLKIGQAYGNGLRRRRPAAGDTWRAAEVLVKINSSRRQGLLRAGAAADVDASGAGEGVFPPGPQR